MVIQVVTADKSGTPFVVLQHSAHIEKDRGSQARFPIHIEARQRNEKPHALNDSFPPALVVRVPPCREPIFMVLLVHPIQRRAVQRHVRDVEPHIVRNNVSQSRRPHFASNKWGAARLVP